MILVSASRLGRQYVGDPVFTGLSFEIRAGERIGLVGLNGCGKTTLLRILAGVDAPDYGELSIRTGIRVSYLQQHPEFSEHETLLDVARAGLGSLLDLQKELELAAQEIAEAEGDDERDQATRRYAQIQDRLDHQDAYSIEHRIEEVLFGLRFTKADLDRPARTFSGGQQSRMMLARLLLESPDLMLLDEPSNHLDIETTEWLESFLARQPVAMVVVSHDRQFLDSVVNRVWELHEGKISVYPGNYTQYWRLREERAKVLERQLTKQQEEIADLKEYIAKYAAGQRAKQAKDRERKLARIEAVETMRSIEGPVMGLGEVERSGDVVIEARNLSKAYDRPLFRDLDLRVQRGECVGIIGPNGAGKSTLIKLLIGRATPDTGEVKLGHKVHIGYYDQGLESLPPDTPIVRAVWPEGDPDWVEQDTRDLLARFGLKGDHVFQTVGSLSGGEQGKAALARLAAIEANVLVMDEPTNHLDIWSCESLERSIRDFEGTVLVVTHDRYFLNRVADRLIVVQDGQARVIEGDYETYQRLLKQEETRSQAKSEGPPAPDAKAAAPSHRERRKRKFPYRKPADVEREIGEAEEELVATERALALPVTWKNPESAMATQQRYDDLKRRIARLYEHWEEAIELNQ
jgi:ATP-binding cassette subfamily F protein 3